MSVVFFRFLFCYGLEISDGELIIHYQNNLIYDVKGLVHSNEMEQNSLNLIKLKKQWTESRIFLNTLNKQIEG